MKLSFILLCFSLALVSCNSETSSTDSTAVDQQPEEPAPTVVDPKPTGVVTEYEFYAPEMGAYSFRRYPIEGECRELSATVLPKFEGSELESLPIEVQVEIEERVYTGEPNFNCRYNVATWICGLDCKNVAIFNMETGKLIDVFETSLGVMSSPSSRILILNPPRSTPYDPGDRSTIGAPSFWEMKDGVMVQVH